MIAALVAGLGLLALTSVSGPAEATTCDNIDYDGASFTVCRVEAASGSLRLFHSDAEGEVLGSFGRVAASLEPEKLDLLFAMNAGMYHDDRSPVGHYLENGEEKQRVITSDGPGNFGLLPNGVFCIGEARVAVIESRAYAAAPPECRYASQSGPMLVIDGALHPRFLVDGSSKFVRNGVGVSADGATAIFAISNEPVNFHHFGRLFRDALQTPNALYFDGKVSRMYARSLGRSDFGFQLGPIVGSVAPRNRTP